MDQISNKSQEFFEFVLPPIDIHAEKNNLIVTIDIPGFKKEDIILSIDDNILSINAEKKLDDGHEIISKQRPNIIDKKIRLPLRVREEEKVEFLTQYTEGVLVIKIPLNNNVTFSKAKS